MQPVYVIAMVITSYIKQHIYHITATNPLRPAGIILCMCPANERRRYNVTSSLIGWAHAQDDHWAWTKWPTVCRPHFQMHWLEWIFIENFNEVYPSRSNSWQVSIGPGNVSTNVDQGVPCHSPSPGHIGLNYLGETSRDWQPICLLIFAIGCSTSHFMFHARCYCIHGNNGKCSTVVTIKSLI